MQKNRAQDQLWRLGVLQWKLRPEQKKLLALIEEAPTDLAVFNISRRFGKSTVCATYCIEQAIRKTQKILYSTAYLTDLQEFIVPIFEWVLGDCPDNMRPTWLASKKQFVFSNGSTIKLIGLDKNANSLRGNNIDVLIVDEAAFVSKLEYLYKSVIIPATMKRKFKLIFPSTPPESPEHFWSKELIQKAKLKNTYIELTLDDISDLPSSERERLLNEVGGEFSTTAQREFFCKILVDSTRTISSNFSNTHITTSTPADIKWGVFGDSGGIKDKTVFLEAGFDHNSGMIVVRRELVFDSCTPTSTIASRFKETFACSNVVLDAPGQLMVDYSSLGLIAVLPQKDEFSAGLLLLDNHFYQSKLLIHQDCKLLIQTLKGGLLTKNRNDYERSETLGHCDAVACLIYALRGVDRTTDLRKKPKKSEIFSLQTETKQEKQLKGLIYAR
jgi:hypothetical protein